MYEWLTERFGEQTAQLIYYGIAALAALIVLWVIWYWIRRLSGGIHLGHGRGRQPRLAVVDAAAIDNNRRIVLIRRDGVEHLVMIGGPNDFVIERGIGDREPPRRDAEEPVKSSAPRPQATPVPPERPAPQPAQRETARSFAVREPAPEPASTYPGRPAPAPEPPARREPAVAMEPAPVSTDRKVERPEPVVDVPDREPVRAPEPAAPAAGWTQTARVEPQEYRDPEPPRQEAEPEKSKQDTGSLENEMERLLSDLTEQKK